MALASVRIAVKFFLPGALGLALLLAGGCATSTIESRRAERMAAYERLSPEEQRLVDMGQIRVGMSADAVYIAWGPPAQVVERQDQQGHVTTWLYHGSYMEENRYWAYRETRAGGQDIFLERYLISDYTPRDYLRAEIRFAGGEVISWATLPRPLN